MEALFLLVSELAMSAQHDLQVAGEVFFPKKIRDSCDAFAFFVGNLQERRIFASDLGHRGVAQESDHLTREMSGAMAFADKMIDLPKDLFAAFRSGSEHRQHETTENHSRHDHRLSHTQYRSS